MENLALCARNIISEVFSAFWPASRCPNTSAAGGRLWRRWNCSTAGRRVIDVAIKHGYNSPDLFARAFCRVARRDAQRNPPGQSRPPKAYPRMSSPNDRERVDRMNFHV